MCRVAERLPWPGSDCLVCSHCEASAVSEQQLTVVCKARGENVRGHRFLPFIYFSLSLGLESDFLFFFWFLLLYSLGIILLFFPPVYVAAEM